MVSGITSTVGGFNPSSQLSTVRSTTGTTGGFNPSSQRSTVRTIGLVAGCGCATVSSPPVVTNSAATAPATSTTAAPSQRIQRIGRRCS